MVYLRWAAAATAALYTAGYAAAGFGLLFFGALWSLLARRSFPWWRSALDLPLAAFAAVLVASALASPFRPLAAGVTLMLVISGAVYFGSFAWLLAHDPGARAVLLRAWALGAVPAAGAALAIGVLTHARSQIPGGVGPNGLGTTLVLAGILQLGLASRARGWERWCWLAGALLGLGGLVATASRASLVGWAAGAAYLAWRELRTRPVRLAVVLAAGGAALVLAGFLAPPLMGRMRTTASDVSQNRIVIWRTSLGMVAARPLLGSGFGTFGTAYDQVKRPQASPEPFAFDLALNLAVETGLLGLLAAVWVAVAAAREWRRCRAAAESDPFRAVVPALWAGLLVDQLADNTLFSIGTSAALWLLLALLAVPPARGGPRAEPPPVAAGAARAAS